MKQFQYCFNILAVLFLLWSRSAGQVQVQAQSGYNYVRPDLTNAGGVTAGGRLASPGTAPVSYPTAVAATGPDSPATTAYGAGLYPSPAVGFTPSGQATTAFGAPASIPVASTSRRPVPPPVLSSAPRSGPYGPQPTQYGTIPRTSGGIPAAEPDYPDTDGDYSAIPGTPGVDYPIYAQVPRTNFDCSQQALPGYYADIEAQCQVFHICALNRTYSFLCPNGTVFSQETLVCVWWNQYDCISAPNLYANNAYIYDYSERATGGQNYRSGAATVTASPTGFIGSQLPAVTGRNSYIAPSPTPALPSSQTPYGAGAVIRPGSANRLTPANAAAGLLAATAAGVQIPDQQQQQRTVGVSGFVQQPQQLQQSVVPVGNREYLPPATAGQRLRGGGGGTTSA